MADFHGQLAFFWELDISWSSSKRLQFCILQKSVEKALSGQLQCLLTVSDRSGTKPYNLVKYLQPKSCQDDLEKSTNIGTKTRLAEQINLHWTTSPSLGLKSHHGDSCGVTISLQNSHLTRQWYDIHETSGGSGLIRVNPTCLLSEDISHSPFCLRAKRNKHKYHLALLIQEVVKCMELNQMYTVQDSYVL